MVDLNNYLTKAEHIADAIDALMLDELHLMAPAAYDLSERDGRVYLIASYDPLGMGRSIKVYEQDDIARRLRAALRMPVTITKKTGTRYVVLMAGKLSLPRDVAFPGLGEKDIFRLGVGLKKEIRIHARDLRNVMIGAAQGQGKSNILHLLSYQMLQFGNWILFLADPQGHTFNPDLWNQVSSVSVAGSHADMLHVLNAVESILADRVLEFQKAAMGGEPPNDIDEYNKIPGIIPLPRIGFPIDEANFFLDNKAIFHRLAELLRQGRKFGLHIMLAAHEWHKEDVPPRVNDMIQTRIALNSLSGAVVLRNYRWGQWVKGMPPGRGILMTNQYTPMQFYRMGKVMARGQLETKKVSPIPESEAGFVKRAMIEADGRMTRGLLMEWGMSERDAREMGDRYEARGWLAKDPIRGNARFVTNELVAILEKFCPNAPTVPTAPTNLEAVPTAVPTTSQPIQTTI